METLAVSYDKLAKEFNNNQNKAAEIFATKYGVTLTINESKKVSNKTRYGLVEWYLFNCTLKRKRYTLHTVTRQLIDLTDTPPTIYQVLEQLYKTSLINNKEVFGSFESFCETYSYTNTDKTIKKYKAAVKEYNKVIQMFDGCMCELQQFD